MVETLKLQQLARRPCPKSFRVTIPLGWLISLGTQVYLRGQVVSC
jgi:hypothetical protein